MRDKIVARESFEQWKAELLDRRDKTLQHIISSGGRRRLMDKVTSILPRYPNCERVRVHVQGDDGVWRVDRIVSRGDL